jgi:hypothetical protein
MTRWRAGSELCVVSARREEGSHGTPYRTNRGDSSLEIEINCIRKVLGTGRCGEF